MDQEALEPNHALGYHWSQMFLKVEEDVNSVGGCGLGVI